MDINLIAIDIAKNVFQLCEVNQRGKVLLEKRLSREKLLRFMSEKSTCLVVIHASGLGCFGYTLKINRIFMNTKIKYRVDASELVLNFDRTESVIPQSRHGYCP